MYPCFITASNAELCPQINSKFKLVCVIRLNISIYFYYLHKFINRFSILKNNQINIVSRETTNEKKMSKDSNQHLFPPIY